MPSMAFSAMRTKRNAGRISSSAVVVDAERDPQAQRNRQGAGAQRDVIGGDAGARQHAREGTQQGLKARLQRIDAGHSSV